MKIIKKNDLNDSWQAAVNDEESNLFPNNYTATVLFSTALH